MGHMLLCCSQAASVLQATTSPAPGIHPPPPVAGRLSLHHGCTVHVSADVLMPGAQCMGLRHPCSLALTTGSIVWPMCCRTLHRIADS